VIERTAWRKLSAAAARPRSSIKKGRDVLPQVSVKKKEGEP